MQVRCLFVHVQDCRNHIVLSESLTQPFQIVVASVAERPVRFHPFHIPVGSGQQYTDSPYLVVGYFPFDTCVSYPMGYRLGTVVHSFGKLHQFPVQMRTGGKATLL